MITVNRPPSPIDNIVTTDNGGGSITWEVLTNGHLRMTSPHFTYGMHLFVNAEDVTEFLDSIMEMRKQALR